MLILVHFSIMEFWYKIKFKTGKTIMLLFDMVTFFGTKFLQPCAIPQSIAQNFRTAVYLIIALQFLQSKKEACVRLLLGKYTLIYTFVLQLDSIYLLFLLKIQPTNPYTNKIAEVNKLKIIHILPNPAKVVLPYKIWGRGCKILYYL